LTWESDLRWIDFGASKQFGVAIDDVHGGIHVTSEKPPFFQKAKFELPPGAILRNRVGDSGLRIIDIDGDGYPDIVFSNREEFSVYLFTDLKHGWSRKVIAGKAGEPGALPPIAINDKNQGFFVHGRSLCWINEATDGLPGFVRRITFDEILKDVEPQAKSPEASLKLIQCAPGFRAELMAAEPLVEDPIAFAFGPDGKLWVVEMGDYPLGIDGKGKFGGKIKFLESTKGDGKYDKATTFLEGLGFPTGVLPWRNGILVTCAPDIFWVENVNGKPGKKEVLFTGFGQGNQQHRVNSLVWGLNNWLYVANGDSGGNIKSLKTGKTLSMSGRDLRIRPDTGEMEAQSGQTQYGRSRDDWGNHFGCNNSNPMYHFALDDHYLRRNPHATYPDPKHAVSVTPGAAPVFPISRTLPRFNDPGAANRFTSACSAIVYRDDLYGPHFANNTFVSEPVHNLVHREIMTPVGATFQSRRAPGEEKSEFVASSDNWFRPTMIQTGPDGCLWIADMYRAVIEHPQWIPPEWQKRLDLRAGHDKGRIYRIVPVHAKPRPIPRLDQLDTAGLVAALDSPNGWQRDMAQIMLLWKNDPAALPLFEKMARESKNPLARLHALCTLGWEDRASNDLLKTALADPHPGVRRQAIRIAESRLNDFPELARHVDRNVLDSEPQVRMQAAYSLGECKDGGLTLGRLAAAYADDRLLLAAILSSANDANLEAMIRGAMSNGKTSAPARELMIIAARKKHRAAPALVADMARLIQQAPDAEQINSLAAILESTQVREIIPNSTLKDLSHFGLKLANDPNSEPGLCVAAIRLVGFGAENWVDAARGLAKFLSPQTAEELQEAAVRRLGQIGGAGHEQLIKAWRGLGPKRRAVALGGLLSQEQGVEALLTAIEKRQIDTSDIDAPARQFLTSHKTQALREHAVKLLAGSIDADRQKVVDAFKPALTLKGDFEKGKAHFAKICAACHKLNGVGNEVGPDLAALAGRSPEYLMIAILDPNRAVEARYVNYIAETKDGRSFSGVLSAETSTSITLVGTEGKPQTILRTNLESLTSTGRSAMPEGLEKDLKHQDLADLLAYVRSGRPSAIPKAFAGNKPEVIAAADDGSLTLPATAAEIYGTTLIFEPQYKNLGYWSSADDYAAWTFRVPKAGRYLAVLEYACDNGNAGNMFAIDTDGGTLTGKVTGTGNWDTYRKLNAGVVNLPAGEQRLTMRPEAGIRGGALIDLKAIRLTPVK
jgi:putative membrane-bound dehydrogenase-like protein